MNVPQHIGIIMDGNGRWARQRGKPRTFGHRAGTDAIRKVLYACGELGVKYLTTYTFSTENWSRPKLEIAMLMDLLVEMTRREMRNLDQNNVRLRIIGNLEQLPKKARNALMEGVDLLKDNTGLTLVLALNYGGRADIVHAAKKLAVQAVADPSLIDSIDEKIFTRYLYTEGIPDPELIIRTSGECRISNFLLWQAAYSELYITDVLWPDFDKDQLIKAIEDYNKRDRRFGSVNNT